MEIDEYNKISNNIYKHIELAIEKINKEHSYLEPEVLQSILSASLTKLLGAYMPFLPMDVIQEILNNINQKALIIKSQFEIYSNIARCDMEKNNENKSL